MKNKNIRGLNAAYYEKGQGIPILFVHCSSASHKEWLPISEALTIEHKIIAPDLPGYGASSIWEQDNRLDGTVDLEFIEALINEAGEALHVIGHSYGGAVSLEAVIRHFNDGKQNIKSLLLIEPVSIHLLDKIIHQEERTQVFSVAHGTIDQVRKGNLEKAAEIYMGFWIGLENWKSASERYRTEIIRTMDKVAAEFTHMERMSSTSDMMKQIQCPVSLVQGEISPVSVLAVMQVLNDAFPHARLIEIPQAGHMSPFTHQEQVTDIIQKHLEIFQIT